MQEAEIQVKRPQCEVKNQEGRKCKECGTEVGKSKQYCDGCLRERKLRRNRVNPDAGPMQCPSAVLNFKRDESGKPIEKRCTSCDTWKNIAEFHVRKSTPSGALCWCKTCVSVKNEERTRLMCEAKDFSILYHGTCTWCKKAFVARQKRSICSDECGQKKNRHKQRIKAQSIHVSTHATCKNCGKSKPLIQFKTPPSGTLKIKPTSCSDCKKQKQKQTQSKPENKPRQRLSKRFHEVMATVKKGGNGHLRLIIGCTTAHLRRHLESRFTRGMRWSNYGTKWHVDHIQPVAFFDHNDPEQVKQCWHYSNLQPLCAIENIRKSDKIITCQPELLLQLVENE